MTCNGGERVPDALKWGPVSHERKLAENIDPSGLLGVGVGLTTQFKKLIWKARAHTGLLNL
jgi:hypothetical protein